jgi:hypothetical protein
MAQHKWHKEIKAWADGAEIEVSMLCENCYGEYNWSEWTTDTNPEWETVEYQYRIKPQHKEPQYLYVYADQSWDMSSYKVCRKQGDFGTYIGKIKLEVED